ncbi:uncharacterized protein [Apostichopus japonicus]|uniref:uncharacterized protein n=1 Tax=Stichopus japonicus TaxID=307972 RepID=UPI003AB1533C
MAGLKFSFHSVKLVGFMFASISLTEVESFPSGAGIQACIDLIPDHQGVTPQTSTPPFDITILPATVTPGATVQVTLSSTDGNLFYRGLAIQARLATGNSDTIGTFFNTDPTVWRAYDCPGSTIGGLTHTNSDEKVLPQVFVWTAPNNLAGDVQFRVTVVRTFTTLWANFASPVLQLQGNPPPNTLPTITCPDPVSVETFPGFEGNVASWDPPTCTDPDQDDTTLAVSCSPMPNTFFPGIGSNVVTCSCTDAQSATVQCTFTVTIVANDPEIMCPPDVVVQSRVDIDGNTANWPAPTCTDADQSDNTLSITCSPPSGSFFPGITTSSVVCTCLDNAGASATCPIQVTVTPAGGPMEGCMGNPCGGNECREAPGSDAGYTCHSVTGQGCTP